MVMGTIAKKMGPIVKQVYLQMAEPRWVMAYGCLCMFRVEFSIPIAFLQGIDQMIPVMCMFPDVRQDRKQLSMDL